MALAKAQLFLLPQSQRDEILSKTKGPLIVFCKANIYQNYLMCLLKEFT